VVLAQPRFGPAAHQLGHAGPRPAAPGIALEAVQRGEELGDIVLGAVLFSSTATIASTSPGGVVPREPLT
jgi:hypothetical protein